MSANRKSKNIFISLLITCAALLFAVPVKAESFERVSVDAKYLRSEIQTFMELLNAERNRLGLEPLQLDAAMMESAEIRAAQASVHFSHLQPNDHQNWDLPMTNSSESAEILAYTRAQKEPGAVANALWEGWHASYAHNKVMTERSITRAGFGIVAIEYSASYTYVYAIGRFSDSNRNKFVPYTGGFLDIRKINSFDICAKYLEFKKNDQYMIYKGETEKVYPRIINNGVEFCEIGQLSSSCGIWSSSNPKVATVDADGNVTGRADGEALLTWRLNGSTKYYQLKVKVSTPKNGFGTWSGETVYYVDDQLYSGWKTVDGKTYYFDPFMAVGKTFIDGKYYYFHPTEGYLMDEPAPQPTPTPKPDPDPVPMPSPSGKPAAVTGKVLAKTEATITLDWIANEKAGGYTIYRKKAGESRYTRTAVINSRYNTRYTVKNLTPGTKYYFVLKAWVKDGSRYIFSEASQTIRGTTRPNTAEIKSVSTSGKNLKVTLWGKAKGATGYRIYYSTRSDFKGAKVMDTRYTTRTIAKNLKKGTYYLKVRSYLQIGTSRVYGFDSYISKAVVK